MKTGPVLALAFAAALIAPSASGAAPGQPPMNDFYQAFYTCGNNTAFTVDYDSDQPTSATLTTSNDRKTYELKRAAADSMSFAAGPVKLTVAGHKATVEGTRQPYQDCSTKAG